jgi:hypothetical protein
MWRAATGLKAIVRAMIVRMAEIVADAADGRAAVGVIEDAAGAADGPVAVGAIADAAGLAGEDTRNFCHGLHGFSRIGTEGHGASRGLFLALERGRSKRT